jgi:hypothetical protein
VARDLEAEAPVDVKPGEVLGRAFEAAIRAGKKDGPPPPMATCPRDDTPLIGTGAFRGAEFFCLTCGGKFGFLAPKPAEATPELNARYEALQAEWDEHVGGKLIVGSREGATDEELAADVAAREWLAERVGR